MPWLKIFPVETANDGFNPESDSATFDDNYFRLKLILNFQKCTNSTKNCVKMCCLTQNLTAERSVLEKTPDR